jgi:Mce-associated membrane protein
MTVDQHSRIDHAEDGKVPDGAQTDDASKESSARGRVRTVAVQVKDQTVRSVRRMLARWRIIVLTVAVVAATALAGGLYYFQYRPNQLTDDMAAQAVVKAASQGTVTLLSYSPETVDQDLAVGRSHLTGEFLRFFNDFSKYFVAPAVRQQNVKASASVLRAAVSELHPKSAVVLLFIHQTTSSKDKPDPVLTTNNVRVTLTKVDESWLISRFEPE